ncbi:hypothetical protein GGR51DRAFT_566912 [Nemania sp. FL0031]|nr:hypothetical protein GGR51DRAFT_566912 [Nemania sp. FL0031]
MHQAAYDGQPVSYPQYSTAPGIIEDYSSAQSAAHSLDFLGDEFSYTSSPASQSPEQILTPASDLSSFPPGTDYSPYPCQQQRQQGPHPATPLSKRVFLTPPPSVSYKPEETDSLIQLESPSFSPAGAQSNEYYSLSTAITSPTGWHVSEAQQLNPPQFSWEASDNMQRRNMAAHAPPYTDQLPRQMPTSSYGGSSFHLQPSMDSESVAPINDTTGASHLTEKSPGLSIHEASPQMGGDIGDPFQFEDEDVQAASVSTGQSEGADGKTSIPYAQLLRRAFLSAPEYKMKLQQIYQWFRENTDKANSDSKGWQNSIRHNLSMNAAFTKCDCKSSEPQETKKSTEWMLADWAVRDGVQSTTRYRKGNPVRRCISTAHHGSASARASSGRKGGINAGKNRSVGSKRSMLSRTANPDILGRHIDPFHGPVYNRSLNYNYATAALNAHPTPSAADWMGRPLHPTATMPTSNGDLSAYTYNSQPHSQVMGNFQQREHAQALYPTAEMIGAYGGPQPPTNTRVHNQHMAPSPRYNDYFPHPQEPADRSGYFTWNPTSGGGGCP